MRIFLGSNCSPVIAKWNANTDFNFPYKTQAKKDSLKPKIPFTSIRHLE